MSDRIFRNLPYVALVLAAALVVVLGKQKRDLVTKYDDLNVRYRRALTEPLPNQYLPSFQTATLDGAPVSIGNLPTRARQVLFVYTTTCGFCKKSIPAWKQLAATLDTLRSTPVQVYGVSLDSASLTRAYSARYALNYATVRFPDERLTNMYRATSVPLTLVLDERGRTVYARLGELSRPAAIDSVLAAVKAPPPDAQQRSLAAEALAPLKAAQRTR